MHNNENVLFYSAITITIGQQKYLLYVFHKFECLIKYIILRGSLKENYQNFELCTAISM